MVECADPERPG